MKPHLISPSYLLNSHEDGAGKNFWVPEAHCGPPGLE